MVTSMRGSRLSRRDISASGAHVGEARGVQDPPYLIISIG